MAGRYLVNPPLVLLINKGPCKREPDKAPTKQGAYRGAVERLQDLLGAALGRTLAVRIAIGDIAGETPAQRDAIERQARHAEAVAALEADPFVRELIERFDATLVESTVRPL